MLKFCRKTIDCVDIVKTFRTGYDLLLPVTVKMFLLKSEINDICWIYMI